MILLIISLNAFPRDYILSTQNDGTKPLHKQGFESLLYYCFPDKKIGVDMLRSAYITHKYISPNFTYKMKEDLARQTRHSIKIAETEYNKIPNVDFEPPQHLEIQEGRAPPALPPPPEKEYFNIKEWIEKIIKTQLSKKEWIIIQIKKMKS